MQTLKKYLVATLIIVVTLILYEGILSSITPEMTENNAEWLRYAAGSVVFLGSTLYWKWLKLLKKFKYNKTTEKWYQVLEDER